MSDPDKKTSDDEKSIAAPHDEAPALEIRDNVTVTPDELAEIGRMDVLAQLRLEQAQRIEEISNPPALNKETPLSIDYEYLRSLATRLTPLPALVIKFVASNDPKQNQSSPPLKRFSAPIDPEIEAARTKDQTLEAVRLQKRINHPVQTAIKDIVESVSTAAKNALRRALSFTKRHKTTVAAAMTAGAVVINAWPHKTPEYAVGPQTIIDNKTQPPPQKEKKLPKETYILQHGENFDDYIQHFNKLKMTGAVQALNSARATTSVDLTPFEANNPTLAKITVGKAFLDKLIVEKSSRTMKNFWSKRRMVLWALEDSVRQTSGARQANEAAEKFLVGSNDIETLKLWKALADVQEKTPAVLNENILSNVSKPEVKVAQNGFQNPFVFGGQDVSQLWDTFGNKGKMVIAPLSQPTSTGFIAPSTPGLEYFSHLHFDQPPKPNPAPSGVEEKQKPIQEVTQATSYKIDTNHEVYQRTMKYFDRVARNFVPILEKTIAEFQTASTGPDATKAFFEKLTTNATTLGSDANRNGVLHLANLYRELTLDPTKKDPHRINLFPELLTNLKPTELPVPNSIPEVPGPHGLREQVPESIPTAVVAEQNFEKNFMPERKGGSKQNELKALDPSRDSKIRRIFDGWRKRVQKKERKEQLKNVLLS